MEIEIAWMAVLRVRMGERTSRVELPDGATVADLLDHFRRRRPDLEPYWRTVRFATETAYLEGGDALPEHEVIYAIPPVSGGV